MTVLLLAAGVMAVVVVAVLRLEKHVPKRYRTHGLGQIQQAVDHKAGRFGGTYHEETIRREVPRIGRNEPCPCGSGQKYKRCCGRT